MKQLYLVLFILCLVQFSFGQATVGSSALVVKLKYGSPGMNGFGGIIELRNTATGKVYKGESRGFNPYVIVEHVPAGNYEVLTSEIAAGSISLVLRDKSLFEIIAVDTPGVYYLGSYAAKKVTPMMGRNFTITKSGDDEPEKIHKQVDKRSAGWQELKINSRQHLFLKDSTRVEM